MPSVQYAVSGVQCECVQCECAEPYLTLSPSLIHSIEITNIILALKKQFLPTHVKACQTHLYENEEGRLERFHCLFEGLKFILSLEWSSFAKDLNQNVCNKIIFVPLKTVMR